MRRGKNPSAGVRGRARIVGGGPRFRRGMGHVLGCFTIVYRHRSTDWPVPYTDSHTGGARGDRKSERVAPVAMKRRETERKRRREE